MAKGELQLLDVAEPPVVSSSRNAPVDVGLDGDQAVGLARVDLQEATSYARVFVRAASAVRPHAVAELDAASAEVFTKLGELVGRRLAVFIDRTLCPAAGNELLIMLDDFRGVGGCVAAGGVEVVVTGELGSDVDRKPGPNGVGEEYASKVVRAKGKWAAVDVA